jgi:hypothetical protein
LSPDVDTDVPAHLVWSSHVSVLPSIHTRLNETCPQLFTGVMAFKTWWYGMTWMSPSAVTTQSTNSNSSVSYAKFYLAVYSYYYHKRGLWVLVMGRSTWSLSSRGFLVFYVVLHA